MPELFKLIKVVVPLFCTTAELELIIESAFKTVLLDIDITAPLLLYSQNKIYSNNCNYDNNSSNNQAMNHITHPTQFSSDPNLIYPRFSRICSLISLSTNHPWGNREIVRYAVLTTYFQNDLLELRRSAQLFKEVKKI